MIEPGRVTHTDQEPHIPVVGSGGPAGLEAGGHHLSTAELGLGGDLHADGAQRKRLSAAGSA